jgi:mono/diheme cytochrome c family protein
MTIGQFESTLDEMGAEEEQMPPFAGNRQERQALAKYVLEKLRR